MRGVHRWAIPLGLVVATLLADVVRHIDKHIADVFIGQLVENLLGLPVATHQTRTP